MILTVIIISYNVKDFLIECLDSIYKTDIENNLFEIIVVEEKSSLIESQIKEILFNKRSSLIIFLIYIKHSSYSLKFVNVFISKTICN